MAKRNARAEAEKHDLHRLGAHLLICTEGSCASRGDQKRALKEARREIAAQGRKRGEGRLLCTGVGCLGVCRAGPIAAVWPDGVFYRRAEGRNLRRIVREHLVGGRVVEDLCIARSGAPRSTSIAGSESEEE